MYLQHQLTRPPEIRFEEYGLSARDPFIAYSKLFPESVSVRLHFHSSFEINLCRGIIGTARIGGDTCDLAADPILLIPAETCHWYEIERCSGSITVFHIHIPTVVEVLSAKEAALCLSQDPIIRLPADPDYFRIGNLLESVCSLPAERLRGPVLMAACSDPTIIRNDLPNGRPAGDSPKNTLRKQRTSASLHAREALLRVFKFVEEHCSEPISLASAAAEAGYERTYFSRFFLRSTGMSLTRYINAVRIEKSLELLSAGISVGDAGYQCGFENPSYFIRQFREHMGMTPGTYINFKLKGHPFPMP